MFYENLLAEAQEVTQLGTKGERKKTTDRIDADKSEANQSVPYTRKCKKRSRSSQSNHDQEVPAGETETSSNNSCRDKVRSSKEDSNLLFYSQTGDIEMIKKLLKACPSINIDVQDRFGWTPLMCATVSGQLDVVNYLLGKGAGRYLCNFQNQNACDLAKACGFRSIKETIEQFQIRSLSTKEQDKCTPFFCDKCNATFKETSLKDHQSSTLHLFNMNLKPKIDTFMIPKSNIGYKLMQKSGWDCEKGLGPEGKGQRLPIKTVLKRDRHCLGSKVVNKKKITHFGPYDSKATLSSPGSSKSRIMSAAAASRKERRKRERRDKEWERNLRQSMDFN